MMCVGMFMAVLDIQVVATSLPTIQVALDIGREQMSWIQTAYFTAEVIAIPMTGFFTRMLSMRGLFVIAVSLFTLASIGCGESGSFGALIIWRVVQGFSGGTLIPTVFSAVILLFPASRQALATMFAGVVALLAPTLGPFVGGWITNAFSWHWLFFINVGPGMIAAMVAFFTLPKAPCRAQEARTLDVSSVGLIAVALASLEVALKKGPAEGWMSIMVGGLLILSTVATYAFVRRTLAARHALIDLRHFADRNFAIGCVLSFILGVALFGSVYLMPVFLAFVRYHDALAIGSIMLVTGFAQLLTAPLAVAVENKCDTRLLSAAGFSALTIGLALSALQTPQSDFDELYWPQVIRGAAFMFCLLPPTRLALGRLRGEQVLDASGLFNLMRNLGGAIGLALIDTVVYSRTGAHALAITERLRAGDIETARLVGIPIASFVAQKGEPANAMVEAVLRPYVEAAAMSHAINDAWMMVALLTASGLLALLFARRLPAV